MTNEQLAALLHQLACRLNTELEFVELDMTENQQDTDILAPLEEIVFSIQAQIKMLTGHDCPQV